jgi:hypothetical protein
LATGVGAEEEGAVAADLGGFVSSHLALTPLALLLPPELLDPLLLLLLLLLDPQAVKASRAAAPTAAMDMVELRIIAPFPGADRRAAARVRMIVCGGNLSTPTTG